MTAQFPGPSPRPVPPEGIRASHDDREAVVERLRDAAAEGRIDFDELDSRLGLALTARTHGELAAITADLPTPHFSSATAPASGAGSRQPLVLKGGMFGASLGPGRWDVPRHVIAHGGVGGVTLDFTRVECRLPEVVVEAYAETSGITVVIPDGWVADTSGIDPGVGGLTDKTTSDRLPGTPLIRLNGSGTMGGVVFRHPNKRERRKLDAS
ncbi:DUF1707 SHOCT-like domain-containing protein [Streptomyces sp. D54]|uniref:DUF1707 SHOCT-like domain-containing protein n=1 Tax=Streptomyces sp. D54 TaxID=1290289 RepID=UPI003CF69909